MPGLSFTTTMALNNQEKPEICRILVVGAARARVAKVLSLFHPSNDDVDDKPSLSNSASTTAPSSTGEAVNIEYIGCVASFSSYTDEATKESIRYLVSVDSYGTDGLQRDPQGIVRLFDEHDESSRKDGSNESNSPLPPIAGVAIGSGLEDAADVERIRTFLKTMCQDRHPLPAIDCIQPNAEFASMQDELQAFKNLSAEEKERMTQLQTMGPAKMAKFVQDFAQTIVQEYLERGEGNPSTQVQDQDSRNEPSTEATTDNDPSLDTLNESSDTTPTLDPTKTRYSCRVCRTILFGDADLQDPPHVPSQHQFSHRKHSSGRASCQSLFLQTNLSWMGTEIATCNEGKFACPNCHSKLGHWNWSGAQCSCGTWVVPAIQVPSSKIDVLQAAQQAEISNESGDPLSSMPSLSSTLPPGTVISPFVRASLRDGA